MKENTVFDRNLFSPRKTKHPREFSIAYSNTRGHVRNDFLRIITADKKTAVSIVYRGLLGTLRAFWF